MPVLLRRATGSLVRPRTSRAHLTWLNRASTMIGTTLDLERTARELADFAVPRLADGAAVDLLESVLRGEDGARGTAAEPPATRAVAVSSIRELEELEPDGVGEPSVHPHTVLSLHCLLAREPVLISRLRRGDYERVAPSPSAAAKLRAAGVHSYLAVPLTARGVLLGVADFIRAAGSPPFTRSDVELAMQLASKAAVFIDNARLYGREREHVLSLQRSLLPRAVPKTPGLEVFTHYTPGSDPGGVGGDWFDVVALPCGRTALVVGDVMGHGLPAAATMGRLRTVGRALLALDIAPDRVLARLDLAARDLEDDQVATCLCAVYDPATESCTIAGAGHLPPLLVAADGTASHVEVPVGAPLGAGVIPYDPVTVPVPAGSRLMLYTDGLVKTREDDLDVRLRQLLAAAPEMVDRLLDSRDPAAIPLGDAERFDESVLLVAAGRRLPSATDLCVWSLPPDGTAAAVARELVTERLARWGLTELADVAELVVSELVGNALRYGGGPGQLRLLRHERLTLEVSDTGPDLPQIQRAELSDEGGRGLQLVNMLSRNWGSCRTPGGKVVWVEQDLPGAAS
ncbi:MAG TPA: SpoIIE family protein phosphatase [Streptomyces sp.]|uniref:ATP-binding SpoIIE family protein phosphatase n=1 Tax=Streptomyces sp. TaxID=1931 RepID=UPI002D59D00F|nr:SpoIIE family protein phosphatase [Streptomyces sp.]HZG02569.1 SpoIIE family protein phosphatase [Streptomyces sp.]